jgi:hypothetical protein
MVLPSCGSSTNGSNGKQTFEEDIAQYDALVSKLEANRTEFLSKEASELRAVRNVLFWLEFPNFYPDLHSWDSDSNVRRRYTFSIANKGDSYNYRGDKSFIVTASDAGDKVDYNAYAFDSANRKLATLPLEAPKDEQRWWAYDVDKSKAYIVRTDSGTVLYSWVPGGQLTEMYKLEQLGVGVGVFMDFKVFDDLMIFIESGRIWKLDLKQGKALWLHNQVEVSGADFDKNGVLFAQGTSGLYYFPLDGSAMRNISEELKSSSYKLNKTYEAAHYWTSHGYTMHNNIVYYIGQQGLYSYNLNTRQITPLLLHPRSSTLRVDYRKPVVLDNGTLFVTGLESKSGAVGAEGPVYKIQLSQ